MPNPTPGDVHVNVPLTNILVGFLQKAENFVWNRVFPLVPSGKQSNLYYQWQREDFWRDEARERAPGTESAGVGARLNATSSFFAHVHAAHFDIPGMTRANSDQPIDLDESGTNLVSQKLMIRQENIWASNFFATGKWGVDLTGVAAPASVDSTHFLKWDVDGSNPIADIRAQIYKQAEKTGYKPNKLTLGGYVNQILSDHADILERIKYTQKAIVTPDLIASLFDLDEVLVALATQATSTEGQTGAYAFIQGKHALLCYAAPAPGIFVPSGGYSFTWNGYLGALNDFGARIKNFYLVKEDADRIEGEIAVDQKVIASDMGTFYSGAVS